MKKRKQVDPRVAREELAWLEEQLNGPLINLHLIGVVGNENTLQDGREKRRKPRMPLRDEHIASHLKAHPHSSNNEVWDAIPTSSEYDELSNDCLYRDDDKVIEKHGDRSHECGRAGFDHRMTVLRKLIPS